MTLIFVPKGAQALADCADALAVLNNRSLEGEPEKLTMQAIKLDPANVKALAEVRQCTGLAPAPLLAEAAKGKVSPDDTGLIFAGAPTGAKIPLAILRRPVSALLLDFRPDDGLGMFLAAPLSTVPQVVVGTRVSKTGSAVAQPSDLESLSAPMAVGASGPCIEIGGNAR